MFISLIWNVVVCIMSDVTLQRLAPCGQTFLFARCYTVLPSALKCHIFNEPSLNHLFAYNSCSVLILFLTRLLT